MPKVELSVPEHLEMQLTQLVNQGDFLSREDAIESLLATGLKAYKVSGPSDDERGFDDSPFDDGGTLGHDDEYVF